MAATAVSPSTGLRQEDLDRRHAAVRIEMAQHAVDCLLVPINENLTYLTGVATIAYGAYLLFPREGNAVFAEIPEPVVTRLYELGWRFYTHVGPGGGARLMCSWDTTKEDVDRFTKDLQDALL